MTNEMNNCNLSSQGSNISTVFVEAGSSEIIGDLNNWIRNGPEMNCWRDFKTGT